MLFKPFGRKLDGFRVFQSPPFEEMERARAREMLQELDIPVMEKFLDLQELMDYEGLTLRELATYSSRTFPLATPDDFHGALWG